MFSCIWPVHRTLSGATSLGQSGSRSDANKSFTRLHHYRSLTIRLFWVISRILVGESYPSAEMPPVYSTALDDWTILWRIFYEQKRMKHATFQRVLWKLDKSAVPTYFSDKLKCSTFPFIKSELDQPSQIPLSGDKTKQYYQHVCQSTLFFRVTYQYIIIWFNLALQNVLRCCSAIWIEWKLKWYFCESLYSWPDESPACQWSWSNQLR